MDSIKMTTEPQLLKGWKKYRVSDIGISMTGNTPSTKKEENYGKHLPFIKPPELSNSRISTSETYLSTEGAKVARILPENSILISCIGNLGKVGINIKPVAFNQQINAIIPNKIVNPLFLFYQAQSIFFKNQLEEKSSATTISIVNKTSFESIYVYIPPLDTQQAIVNKIESLFDEIDEGIGRLKTAAQQIQQYRQSLLKNAFNGELTKEWRSKHADALPSENELLAQIQTTREQHHAQQLADWQNITIGEVVTISPKKEKAIDDDTDVSFSSMHLMSSSLSEHLTYEIKKWADVKKGFTVFRNNDVLLAKITPCFENGKSAVAQDLINGIGTGSTEFMVLRSSNQILPKFLYFLVNTPDFRQAGIHNMTGSVGHKRVPKDFVSTWAFSLPPLAEQTEIVAILESKLTACDQLADELAKQLKQAEMLKQAVLKAAFSGGLLDK